MALPNPSPNELRFRALRRPKNGGNTGTPKASTGSGGESPNVTALRTSAELCVVRNLAFFRNGGSTDAVGDGGRNGGAIAAAGLRSHGVPSAEQVRYRRSRGWWSHFLPLLYVNIIVLSESDTGPTARDAQEQTRRDREWVGANSATKR